MRVKFEKAHSLVTPEKTVDFKAGAEATISQEQFDKLPAGVAESLEAAPKAPAKKGG